MVTYAATLDVPRHVVDHLSRPPATRRRRVRTLRGSRALGPFRQAVLVLRWFRERGCVHCLARDVGVSRATGYRYLHEVLDRCRREGMTHVVLDGTLIESDRLAGVRDNGNDLWFSQKHRSFGGNVQFLSAPDGTPLWVSDVEPDSTPDITTAAIHALPALYKAAAPRAAPNRSSTGTLARTQARHHQPQPDRRHHPRRPRPQQNLEVIFIEKTSLAASDVLQDNDPDRQEQTIKFNELVANCLIFHTAVDITKVANDLIDEGREVDPVDLATVTPYVTSRTRRCGTWYLDMEPPENEAGGRPRNVFQPGAGFHQLKIVG